MCLGHTLEWPKCLEGFNTDTHGMDWQRMQSNTSHVARYVGKTSGNFPESEPLLGDYRFGYPHGSPGWEHTSTIATLREAKQVHSGAWWLFHQMDGSIFLTGSEGGDCGSRFGAPICGHIWLSPWNPHWPREELLSLISSRRYVDFFRRRKVKLSPIILLRMVFWKCSTRYWPKWSVVCGQKPQWDMYLPLLTAAYRSTVHPGTGFTPNMMMSGREVNLPLDVLYGMPQREQGISDYVQQLHENLEMITKLVRILAKLLSSRSETTIFKFTPNCLYVPGDLGYWQNPPGKKLEHLWIGPLVGTKEYNASLYQVTNRKKSCMLHHDLLRPYIASLVPNWAQALHRNCQKAN